MKNFSILTLLAALLFMGCSDIFVELESPLTNETTLPDLTANFADDGLTRTYVEAGKYLRWHEADLITAFFGNTLNRQYKFNGATGANSGTFSLVPNGELGTGNTLDAIYAIYPYDASATISDDGLISLTLPSEQSYAENSFGKGANTMVAVTESVEDTFLSFKNACGYLKLYLYNVDGATLKSVSVKGNNNEKIAGAATVAMTFGDTPEVTMSNDATTSVTLDCGEGIALGTTSETATALWIVLPETTFEKGITITVTDTEGSIFEKSTSNSVAITRNDIQPMAALAVEFVAPVVKPANNEIWYTNGSTTEATTPYKTDVFGANILSNTYDAKKECWVIKFDGEVTSIGGMAFYNCSSLTSVTIPDSVTTIGYGAFMYCSSLTSVTIPDSVTTIEVEAFRDCTGELIVNCNIPSAISPSYAAFYNSKFTKVTIGDSVTTIGDYAFCDCRSLTSITIPDSVTTIGNYAFENCSSLTTITIPDSVTTIGYRAFCRCRMLQEFKGKFASDDGRCLIQDGTLIAFAPAGITEYTIPDSVTKIGQYVFFGCSSLTSVTIPDSVTTIGTFAFNRSSIKEFKGKFAADSGRCLIMDNTIVAYAEASGTTYTIPDSVKSIGKQVFHFSNITSVTIPDGVTEIGLGAFSYCYNLTNVIISDSVTTIGSHAFDCNFNLTSVTIGDSVTTIGDYAFYCCESLTSVTVPDSVTSIGENAFSSCTSLTSVYITDIAAWCNISFGSSESNGSTESNPLCYAGNLYLNNELVTDLIIPDSVTSIGDRAFYGCDSLTSVTIPDSVTSIGNWAFYHCDSLKEVYCKPTMPPTGGYYLMFGYNASGIKIYVPRNSVSAYKSASGWSDYKNYIVGYDF